ncbi:MAG TPA: radical SAM protein [Geobacterales bacterium]|nr:radical SAM protein [Geobacterales bacterium]
MRHCVVLTADRGSFTDYGGSSALGYVACMPYRLVPRIFMDRIFTPPIPADNEGRAYFAPYALRKVEAALYYAGIKDVIVTPPEYLERVVNNETKILGLTAHDPLGIDPVSTKLCMLFGGGPSWTARFFEELGEKVSRLKKKYNFKVIVGGPAAWELIKERPDWLDVLYIGEAEHTLPSLVNEMLNGKDVPKLIYGKDAKIDEIPPILYPARLGEVQITRGCPRGCSFCSITPETFRSIPLDIIKKEIEVNLKGGIDRVEFITDDIMLYGSQRLRVNHDAITKLYKDVMVMGVDGIWFPHISAPPVKESPKTIREMAEIAHYSFDRADAPVVGLETGSERIFTKYMRAKSFPYEPRQWRDVIIDATTIMNENYIYPCYTMTIGYFDETEEDVELSIKLVQDIIDHELTAWVFPLPVIPMETSRIRKNPFPTLKKMPRNYWDLLYISWKYNFKITRKLVPALTSNIKNKMINRLAKFMIDKIFDNIEWVFLQLKETKGLSSLNYRNINLNNTIGVIRALTWLFRLGFKSL